MKQDQHQHLLEWPRRCSDSHYVTFWQLEDHSAVSFCLGNQIGFFLRRAVSGEEGVEKTHASGSELVNINIQLLHAMRYAGPMNCRGSITTAVFLRSLATFSWGAQGKLWNLMVCLDTLVTPLIYV